MQFTSMDDGYRWKFGRGSQTMTLNMRAWSFACKAAIEAFEASVISLSCGRFDGFFLAFCGHQIEDRKVQAAPYRQSCNQSWMQQIMEDLYQEIYKSLKDGKGSLNSSKADMWFQQEQCALSSLAQIFCLAVGVPFRGWQLASVYWDCSQTQKRNVWVLKDGRVIVSHPQAKQRNKVTAPTLVSFPQTMSSILSFYLFIIRPIACKILSDLQLDSSLHATTVWVHSITCKRKKIQVPSPWTGAHVSQVLKDFTKTKMGWAMSPLSGRQATQAVFRDMFPQLFSSPGGKSSFAELDQYGHQCGFPSWKDLPVEKGVRLLAVSQIWQALLNIDPVNPVWRSMLENSLMFSWEETKNLEKASLCAHHQIGLFPARHKPRELLDDVRRPSTVSTRSLNELPSP